MTYHDIPPSLVLVGLPVYDFDASCFELVDCCFQGTNDRWMGFHNARKFVSAQCHERKIEKKKEEKTHPSSHITPTVNSPSLTSVRHGTGIKRVS